MQSMHQYWESEKLNLHLEACLLAFLSNPPNRCFHKRNFAFQENCILFIRQVSFPGSFYCIFPRRRMIHFLVFGGHVGALTQFFTTFLCTSPPKLLWAPWNLPLLKMVWEWPPDPKGPGQLSFENIPRFGPKIGTLGTPGGPMGPFFSSKMLS